MLGRQASVVARTSPQVWIFKFPNEDINLVVTLEALTDQQVNVVELLKFYTRQGYFREIVRADTKAEDVVGALKKWWSGPTRRHQG